MSQEVTKIKKRISSVSGALKVTSAMKLVSTVKLKKWKNKMIAHREYSENLKEVTDLVLSFAKRAKTPFNVANTDTDKSLYIIVSSTLGLCGSYNNNIFKLADVSLKEKDDAVILGNKGLMHYENGAFTKIEGFEGYNSVQNESVIKSLTSFITSEYLKGNYHEIHLIYSEYKNSLVFVPKDYVILPLKEVETDVLTVLQTNITRHRCLPTCLQSASTLENSRDSSSYILAMHAITSETLFALYALSLDLI